MDLKFVWFVDFNRTLTGLWPSSQTAAFARDKLSLVNAAGYEKHAEYETGIQSTSRSVRWLILW